MRNHDLVIHGLAIQGKVDWMTTGTSQTLDRDTSRDLQALAASKNER